MKPFVEYILKLAGRCNINCDYCYMFKLFDQGWRRQPSLMAPDVWQTTAAKIRGHVERTQLPRISVCLHGGEPLLLGKKAVIQLLEHFQDTLDFEATTVEYSIQTNATLLDQEWIDIFYHYGVVVGISLDGDREANDRHRVDHLGRSTYQRVHQSLELMLASEKGQSIFGGVLSVIDLANDPATLLHYLAGMGVKYWYVQPPDGNYLRMPYGKRDLAHTSYADWIIELFDANMSLGERRLRIEPLEATFRAVQNLGPDSLPTGEVLTAVVVEANGEIHSLDTFKISAETGLGLSIFEHEFEDTWRKELMQIQLAGVDGLAAQCRACPIVAVCNGGKVPHRFSQERGFHNPTIFCADQTKLIAHMQSFLAQQPGAIQPQLEQLALPS